VQIESELNTGRLEGRVVTGAGQGAGFTRLDWAREQFMAQFGIDPYPGTLNVRLIDEAGRAAWAKLQSGGGFLMRSPDAGSCHARGYPVRIAGQIPAAIVRPDVTGYPDGQIELICAVALRETLDLADGDTLQIDDEGPRSLAAVVFDVDGTLVNSVDGIIMAAERAAAAIGYEVRREDIKDAMNNIHSFWEKIVPASASSDVAMVEKLRRETMAHWPQVLEEHVVPFAGLKDTLSCLKSAGIQLGIYTGSDGTSFRALEKEGLLDWFEVVITSKDVTRHKPDPEGLLLCMERLGVEPSQAAYIGDSVPDIRAAHAAGVWSIGVLTGAGDSALLSAAGAHRLVADNSGLRAIFNL
jgi:HAD superfamily hydrolase (TIGR01549 family)